MLTKARLVMAVTLGVTVAGCRKDEGTGQRFKSRPQPRRAARDPEQELPFRYPPSLYSRKAQANVILRVFIDKEGQIIAESTHVAETSGHASMDSAAVKGSTELRFIPAKTRGQAVAVSILFPVYFRHPEATPLPGDTVLGKAGTTGTEPADTSR